MDLYNPLNYKPMDNLPYRFKSPNGRDIASTYYFLVSHVAYSVELLLLNILTDSRVT